MIITCSRCGLTSKDERYCIRPNCGELLFERYHWNDMKTAPRDGTWILLKGESGYIGRPYRVHVAQWNAEYRPHNPWQTSEGCAFEDDGNPPIAWMPII